MLLGHNAQLFCYFLTKGSHLLLHLLSLSLCIFCNVIELLLEDLQFFLHAEIQFLFELTETGIIFHQFILMTSDDVHIIFLLQLQLFSQHVILLLNPLNLIQQMLYLLL